MNPTPPPPLPPHTAATFIPSCRPNLPPPPPPTSLENALSELSSLIQLSTTALRSLPAPIKDATSTTAATLVPCPFNPNHRLPPSSLFSHYLNCPSPLSLAHSFQYPLTLRSASATTAAAAAPPTVPAESSEITVSLEKYISYNVPANNFFYQNCPGPVTPYTPSPSSLNLPRILYTECADFNREAFMDFSLDFIRFLPSEIWAVLSEIESWGGGFPAVYSSRILRAILMLRDYKLLHLYDWIIANSPRYGVIIDCALRDHVVLLVKLCLKAIVVEALELAGVTCSNRELKETKNVLQDLGNRSFECPGLVKVMVWLALQLSFLYGEVNGKYFAVDILKECIKDSALRASLFAMEGEDEELNDGENVGWNVKEQVQSVIKIDSTERDGGDSIEREAVGSSMIFISEVGAAVAALHERYLVEEKIKALRNARPPSAYQRNMEHAHVSKIADEERKKRPDYRPVVEHDGFLRHRSNNQDANKVKTREELLAEERDYKRRRMSYRGKKLKRNTVEIMRDIIEENMEEIRQAAGFGDLSEAVEVTEALASENVNRHESTTNSSGSRRNFEAPEYNRGRSVDYRKETQSRHCLGDFKNDNWQSRQISSHYREQMHGRENADFVEAFPEDNSRGSHHRRSESQESKYYKSSRDEHEPKTNRRRDDHNQKTHRRRRDEHERSSHKRERDEDNWERDDRYRRKRDSASRDRYEDNGDRAGRRESNTNRNSTPRRKLHEFDDRYDPAANHDLYEDDY